MRPNPQKTADLVTYTKEILNGKLHFCVVFLLILALKLRERHINLVYQQGCGYFHSITVQ